MVGSWLVVAALVAAAGAGAAHLSNFYQQAWEGVWRTGLAQTLFKGTRHERFLFAPQFIAVEWNLFSSFLLVPLALGLWAWHRQPGGQAGLVAAVGAIVFGLVAGVTRAAWVAMVGIIALWCGMRRPRRRQVATLGMMIVAALLVQALAFGFSPVGYRLFDGDTGLARLIIARATLEPEGRRALLGSAAGSTTRLSVVMPEGKRVDKLWIGNLELFVFHDSGILGLATFFGLVGVVCVRATRALRRGAGGGASPLIVPLLVAGGALGFAYQFTHGLWLMYPYVYLGLLTAVTGAPPDESKADV
jgi:O-antigen ligase